VNLVLLQADELGDDGRVRLTGSRAVHIIRVLRAGVGRVIRVGLLNGPRGSGWIERVDDATVDLLCRLDPAPPAPPFLSVILALPRPKVMKRLWAQLAAIGLQRIILTNAAKVERSYFDTHWLDPENYTPLLFEGLSQSGDTLLPDVRIERRLKPFLEDDLDILFPADHRFLAHPRSGGPLADVNFGPRRRILMAIGPEGGWTDYELDLFEEHRFQPINMGPRTLRTDTACIALLGALHALMERAAP